MIHQWHFSFHGFLNLGNPWPSGNLKITVLSRITATLISIVAVKREDSNAIQTEDSAQIQLRFSLMNCR